MLEEHLKTSFWVRGTRTYKFILIAFCSFAIDLTCHAKDRKESKDRRENKSDNMHHKTFFLSFVKIYTPGQYHFNNCLLNV